MTTVNIVNDKIVNECVKANKGFITGYGKISGFLKKLSESGIDIGEIEASVNEAMKVGQFTKPEVSRLDKAYQAASRRILNAVVGLEWDDTEQHGMVRFPAPRSRKSDKLNKLYKDFRNHPEDADIFQKFINEAMKLHKKKAGIVDSATTAKDSKLKVA